MSEPFFEFKIICPNCGAIDYQPDGYESDSYADVFVFSGDDETYNTSGYCCPRCERRFKIDHLFTGGYVTTESIDKVKECLSDYVEKVIYHERISDRSLEPNLELVVRRYSALYPADKELREFKNLYYYAYHNPRYLVKFEPILGTDVISRNMILYPKTLQKVYLPDGLKSIMDRTFSGCYRLMDVFLPKSVKYIGVGAFENCSGLVTIHTSDGLETIGDYAFSKCTSLKTFFFPDGIKNIGNASFKNCRNLKKVYIPEGCSMIGESAFEGCKDIVFSGKPGTIAEEYAKLNNFVFVPE